LRSQPKWLLVEESSSSGLKHSRASRSQQSDARTSVDINDDSVKFEDVEPPRRPVGRDIAKKGSFEFKRRRLEWGGEL